MKKIHIVKHTPLKRPRQHRARPVHQLKPVLLLITPKLVVVHNAPRERRDHVDPILVDGFEHFRQKLLVIRRALEVVALRVDRARVLHERVEPKLGDRDASGAERVPDVAEVLAEVLRR